MNIENIVLEDIIEHNKILRDKLTAFIEELEDLRKPQFTNIKAEQTKEYRITLTWETNKTGNIDILFYNEGDEQWKHSARKYGHKPKAEDKEFPVDFVHDGVTKYGKKYFKIVYGEWPSPVIEKELKRGQ